MNPARSVQSLLESLCRQLTCHAENPRLAAELLVSHLLGCPRLELPLHATHILPETALHRLQSMTERLKRHEPLQYITRQASFMHLHLRTDRRALIPRPETEQLVERVLADKVLWQHGQPCIADVGTGSGCITLAMAQAQPRARYIAIDISTPALTLARENARRCGIRADIEWREDDLLARQPAESLHGIIANLPYIPTAQWQQLPPDVRLNEPRSALDGGPDGLDVIRILTAQAGQTLLPGGVLWMEIGEDQGESVEKMLNHHGFGRIGIQTDLTNRTRFATGRKP